MAAEYAVTALGIGWRVKDPNRTPFQIIKAQTRGKSGEGWTKKSTRSLDNYGRLRAAQDLAKRMSTDQSGAGDEFSPEELDFTDMRGCIKVMVIGEMWPWSVSSLSTLRGVTGGPAGVDPDMVTRCLSTTLSQKGRTWLVVAGRFGDEPSPDNTISRNLRVLVNKKSGVCGLWAFPDRLGYQSSAYTGFYPEFRRDVKGVDAAAADARHGMWMEKVAAAMSMIDEHSPAPALSTYQGTARSETVGSSSGKQTLSKLGKRADRQKDDVGKEANAVGITSSYFTLKDEDKDQTEEGERFDSVVSSWGKFVQQLKAKKINSAIGDKIEVAKMNQQKVAVAIPKPIATSEPLESRSQNPATSEEMKIFNDRLQQLESEMKDLVSSNMEVLKENDKLKDDNDRLQRSNGRLRRYLRELRVANDQLHLDHQELKDTVELQRGAVEELTQEVRDVDNFQSEQYQHLKDSLSSIVDRRRRKDAENARQRQRTASHALREAFKE
ncbi:hypothetical protein OQA88_9489 [Cercophora sp. LCS_1]